MQSIDIVNPNSKFSCCFTKAYNKYHGGISILWEIGTGSILQTKYPFQQSPISRDVNNLKQLSLRYFSPKEISRLFGFPEDFSFPDSLTDRQQYALIGNVTVLFLISESKCESCF